MLGSRSASFFSCRGEVLELFLGAPNMSLEVFRTFFANDPGVDDTDDPTQQPRNKKTRDWLREHMTGTVEKIFRKMDSNGDELLSVDEVYEAPSGKIEYFFKLFVRCKFCEYHNIRLPNSLIYWQQYYLCYKNTLKIKNN